MALLRRRGPKPRETNDLVCIAVRQLRERLGETQQDFAWRLDTTVRSVARWESVKPPGVRGLLRLRELAGEHRHYDLLRVFHFALAGIDAVFQNRLFPMSLLRWIRPDIDRAASISLEEDAPPTPPASGEELEDQFTPRGSEHRWFMRFARASEDLLPLLEATENPDEYADELTAWRVIRREIERKLAKVQPKASTKA